MITKKKLTAEEQNVLLGEAKKILKKSDDKKYLEELASSKTAQKLFKTIHSMVENGRLTTSRAVELLGTVFNSNEIHALYKGIGVNRVLTKH